MGRMDQKLLATYAGKYGHYEIRKKWGAFGDHIYIYKDMEYWKNARDVADAVKLITEYDSSAKPVG